MQTFRLGIAIGCVELGTHPPSILYSIDLILTKSWAKIGINSVLKLGDRLGTGIKLFPSPLDFCYSTFIMYHLVLSCLKIVELTYFFPFFTWLDFFKMIITCINFLNFNLFDFVICILLFCN